MVIKNCEDKYTYLFRVTKTNVKIPFAFDIIGFGVLVKVCFV